MNAQQGDRGERILWGAGFLEYYAYRSPGLVGMEACGGSRHWARELEKMEHQVRLMQARFFKAFRIGNKTQQIREQFGLRCSSPVKQLW